MFDYSVWQLRQTWVLINTSPCSVCKTCFFWLRQLRRVSRSLDTESLKTLVHAFVTSRVDYCNSCSPGLIAEVDHWWPAAGIECCCSSRPYTSDLWHRQVRSRSVTAAPRWTALAWHSSAGAVQACRDRSPMSPESSTDVPCQSLHSHLPSLKSLFASTYDPPDANNWMYHASAVLSVVASLHPPVRQSGIHCRTIFASRLSDWTMQFQWELKLICLPVC